MPRLASLMAAVFMILGVSLAHAAEADNLNLFGGSHLGLHERGLFAAELAIPMLAEVGPFVKWSHSVERGAEDRYTFGAMGRITLPWLGFFTDARAGLGWAHISGAPTQNGFDLELGLGYRFAGAHFDLLPRLGFNVINAGPDVPVTNLTLGVAFVL